MKAIHWLILCVVFNLLLGLSLLAAALPESGNEPAPVPEHLQEVLDPVQRLLVDAAGNQWVAWLITAVVACRLLIKPAISFLRWRAEQTESKADDEWVDRIEQSAALRSVSFLLDWLFSLKLGRK